MSWFDRSRGEMPAAEAWERLGEAVEKAGLAAILHEAAGLYGLRRFIVRFELRAGRPRVTGLESTPLPKGGGPPEPAAFAANVNAVEAGLATLKRALPPGFTFDRGAMAFIRGGPEDIQLLFRFDSDADAYTIAELPVPMGEANPVEDPDYQKALAAWENRIAPVRERWLVPRAGETWSIANDLLTIHGPDGDRVIGADPIALYWPRGHRFEWLVAKPVGDEAPFVEPVLTLEQGGAMELAVFAAARMKHVGVFQAEIEGEKGEVLFAALRE